MAYVSTPFTGELSLGNLLTYMQNEFLQLSRSLTETDSVQLRALHVAPTKPREGLVVYADGSDWNPGAGKGVYVYTGSGWSKL